MLHYSNHHAVQDAQLGYPDQCRSAIYLYVPARPKGPSREKYMVANRYRHDAQGMEGKENIQNKVESVEANHFRQHTEQTLGDRGDQVSEAIILVGAIACSVLGSHQSESGKGISSPMIGVHSAQREPDTNKAHIISSAGREIVGPEYSKRPAVGILT
jgi:hypothetical protein